MTTNRTADDVLRQTQLDNWENNPDIEPIKQQLLADILSLPCLQDEVTPEKTTIPSSENKRYRCADCADFDYCDHDVRDEFRTELRQALTAYFMGTVGGENLSEGGTK